MTRDGRGPDRDLRSYGRRRGRKPSTRQQALWSEVLPRVAMPTEAEALRHPARLFAPGVSDVWLEIGFGGGEHLLWQARNNLDAGVIGCEPFEDGVTKVLSALASEGVCNIRIHAADARPLVRRLPDSSLGRVFVLFPDPWPKKRHHKRRLLSPETVNDIARAMRPGAELRIATDVGEYACAILRAVLGRGHFEWTAACAGDWRHRPDDWPGTRYEAKALQEGRKTYYFRFRRLDRH
jgi:tRNA (guanine-N7-)-methyltransferase